MVHLVRSPYEPHFVQFDWGFWQALPQKGNESLKSLVDPLGRGFNFPHFHAVFSKILPNNRLAHVCLGNAGSVTGYVRCYVCELR